MRTSAHYIIALILFYSLSLSGQVKIGFNPETIDPGSILELESDSKVLVISRLTDSAMNALIPLRGALVYNTDAGCIYYFDGSRWINLCEDTGAVNISLETNEDSLVLLDSNDNTVSVPLDSINTNTFTSNPIVNPAERDSTIVITQTGNNYNFEVGMISGENIIDTSINGQLDIQNGSITGNKIQNDAINASLINENVAGTGLTQDATGALQVDVSLIAGDGALSSPNATIAITGEPSLALFDDVGIDIATGSANQVLKTNAAGTNVEWAILDATSLAGQNLTATDGSITVTNGTGATLVASSIQVADDGITSAKIRDGQVQTDDIANDAVDAETINPDVAGNGLQQNATSGALEVNVGDLTGDGTISSTDLNVTGGTNAALNDVSLEIANDAVDAETINPDVAGNGLQQNATSGALEVNVGDLTGDGTISSTDLNVTGGTNAALNDVSLEIANDAVDAETINPDVAGNGLQQNATSGALEVNVGDLTGDGTISSTDLNVTGGANAALNDVSLEIANDAVDAETINPDVAGNGLQQNATSGALEVNVGDLTGDGTISSTDLNVTGGTNAALNDVSLEIANDAVDAETINPDVAGNGLQQNATSGALEVNVGDLTGDGTISSTDLNVTGGTNAALNDVSLEIANDAVDAETINPDVAGNGLQQNATSGALEVNVGDLTGDGTISSTDLNVTGGTNAALNDVSLEIANDAVDAETINPDVAGNGLQQNATSGALEVNVGDLTGDGTISSTDLNVTGGTNAALNDVSLEIANDAVDAETINPDVAGNGLQQNATSGALEVNVGDLTGDGTISSTDLNVTGGTNAALNDVSLEIANDAVDAETINPDVAGNGLQQNVTSGALEVNVGDLTGDGTISSTDLNVTGGTNAALNDVSLEIANDAVDAETINPNVAGNGLQQNATSGALDIISGNAENQILKWNNTTTTWELGTDNDGTTNLATDDLIQDAGEDRTYNINVSNLFFRNGNIGIGALTGAPQSQLDVNGQIQTRTGFASTEGTAGNPGYGFYTNGDTNTGIFRAAEDQLAFSTGGTEAMRIDASQNVGIGPAFGGGATIDARLHVDGNIYASNGDFFSTSGSPVQPIPDYVFQNYFDGFSALNGEYQFKSLHEIEKFIKEHKHLPGVTSAEEAKKNGSWNLSQSNLQNLEKIEELFLHTIEQEKKIKDLKQVNEELAKEVDSMKKELALIKALLTNKGN